MRWTVRALAPILLALLAAPTALAALVVSPTETSVVMDPNLEHSVHFEFNVTNTGPTELRWQPAYPPSANSGLSRPLCGFLSPLPAGATTRVRCLTSIHWGGGAPPEEGTRSALPVEIMTGPSGPAVANFTFRWTLSSPRWDPVLVSGHVRDASGAPIAGAEVRLVDHEGTLDNLVTLTDARGAYTVPARAGVPLTLTVQAPGFTFHHEAALVFRADAKHDVALAAHPRAGSFRPAWREELPNPVYEGAVSADGQRSAIGAGEHGIEGYHARERADFTWSPFVRLYRNDGTLLFHHNVTIPAGHPPELVGGVWALAIDATGSRVAYGTNEGRVGVLDANGTLLWESSVTRWHGRPPDPRDSANGLAFSRDGSRLAITAGSEVALVDPATGEKRWGFAPHDHGTPRGLVFEPDGHLLVGSAHLYRLTPDGTLAWRSTENLGGFPFTGRGIARSPDGSIIALAGAKGGRIAAFNATGGERFHHEAMTAGWWVDIPDDASYVAWGSRGFVGAYAPNGTLLWRYYVGETAHGGVTPDGRHIVYATVGHLSPERGPTSHVGVLDRDGTLLWRNDLDGASMRWQNEDALYRFVAMNDNATRILVGGGDGTLRAFEGSVRAGPPAFTFAPIPPRERLPYENARALGPGGTEAPPVPTTERPPNTPTHADPPPATPSPTPAQTPAPTPSPERPTTPTPADGPAAPADTPAPGVLALLVALTLAARRRRT